MDDIDLVVRAHELAISDAQYTLNDYKEMLKEKECQLVRSVKEATDEELEEILGKKDKYKNLTVKNLKAPIQVPTEFEDIPHQYCSNIVQHITTASEEEDAFIFEHISSYVSGVMQHEGITKIPKRLLERALICFKEEHKEEWNVLMGIEEETKNERDDK